MLNKLVKIANKLDKAGLTNEADQLDAIIKIVAQEQHVNGEKVVPLSLSMRNKMTESKWPGSAPLTLGGAKEHIRTNISLFQMWIRAWAGKVESQVPNGAGRALAAPYIKILKDPNISYDRATKIGGNELLPMMPKLFEDGTSFTSSGRDRDTLIREFKEKMADYGQMIQAAKELYELTHNQANAYNGNPPRNPDYAE